MIRRLCAPLLAIVVCSCAAGPGYRLPQSAIYNSPAARAPFLGRSNPAFAETPLPDHWWRLYDDPRLDAYVRQALVANTDLRAADANFGRAVAAIREARAAKTPDSEIAASIADTRQGGIDTLSFPAWSYSAAFGLSYPLDLAGGIRRTIEAARANAEAVAAARDQVRTVVAAAVARNYVAVCSANESLAAADHVVNVQRQTLNDVERLFHDGRNTAFDVTRAQTALDESEATIPPILAGRQAALYALAALMGEPAADYPRELEDCASPPPIRQPIPIGDGAALIRRRSDVRAAERELAAATASIGIETADLYPQISIGGALGFAAPFSRTSSVSSFGGNIGPLLSWTFPNRVATRARIAEAGAAAEAAEAEFDGTVLIALQQTETALDGYVREYEHEQALGKAEISAAKAVAQARALFRFGRVGFLDVLNAEADLASTETAFAASNAAVADAQVNLFFALGGGWGP